MTTDLTILINAITAVVNCGTSLAGGVGAMSRTAGALASVVCLGNRFNQLNVSRT